VLHACHPQHPAPPARAAAGRAPSDDDSPRRANPAIDRASRGRRAWMERWRADRGRGRRPGLTPFSQAARRPTPAPLSWPTPFLAHAHLHAAAHIVPPHHLTRAARRRAARRLGGARRARPLAAPVAAAASPFLLPQKHLRCTIDGPASSYSDLAIHIC
jgi:hypothetical protein